ncbi:MAG: glucose-1-phosphate adenylyltransferase [Burkholderiales bacterium]|nr:glucose-1-phosphate adenylyltransferase [Burkholderiales bacterium]
MSLREGVLGIVLAGGEGTRLSPLTAERSKPAVPFSGRYRIVDFALSNLVNSGIYSIYVLVQYKSQSLIEHIREAWVLGPTIPSHFITVVPPQMREGPEWFQGTADAVYQNLALIEANAPDVVAVFGADHVYRMDLRQMIDFHLACDADATVAALPVPLAQASAFGVIDCDAASRIRAFVEKPPAPPAMPNDPTRAYASMGNYIFRTSTLIEALIEARDRSGTDFGRDVLPRLLQTRRVFAYDFALNVCPGMHRYEEANYWRDVGTIDAYFDATMDTLGVEPRFDLMNPRWPIRSSNYQGPPASFGAAHLRDCDIGAGVLIRDATLSRSVVRADTLIGHDVVIEDSIVFDGCTIGDGARIRRAIIDRHNTVAPGAHIGYNRSEDEARYTVTESGIAVVPLAPLDQRHPRFGS